MYWNELNEDNIEYAKELYYDYLAENKNKLYTNELKRFDEFLEDEVKICKRCNKPELWDLLEEDMCEDCYYDMHGEQEEPDHYEDYRLKEEGWL